MSLSNSGVCVAGVFIGSAFITIVIVEGAHDLSGFVALIYASQRYSSFRSSLLWFLVALIFDDVFSVELKWLSLMSLSNSGFCVDVVCKYLGYVAGVFE